MKSILRVIMAFIFLVLIANCNKKEDNQKPVLLINRVLTTSQFTTLLDESESISQLLSYTQFNSTNCSNPVLHEGESVQVRAEVFVRGIYYTDRKFYMREIADSSTGSIIYLEIRIPSIIKLIDTKADTLTPVETNNVILDRLLTKIRDSTFVFKTVVIGLIKSEETNQNNICSRKLFIEASDLYLP
jgi:hypothetical protein